MNATLRIFASRRTGSRPPNAVSELNATHDIPEMEVT